MARRRARMAWASTGGENGWLSNEARRWATTSSALTGWLKCMSTIGAASKRLPGRYQFVCSSFAVAVVKLNV